MTRREFEEWVEFYRLNPFDDLHRYHRPAALIASRVGNAKVQAMLDFLNPERGGELNDTDLAVMKAFGFERKGGADAVADEGEGD